ncbi:SpoIIE family protein phosphatase [Kineococcus sp. T13]|uniref:PP2C family protein-serine/threonine phosphatase n=1 Tax=Kineococcus vitellinus TaxID=2696565 RepID=UPI00141328A0|nr:PP2C family protein-serine/threonine phosphatase [Kineococcus vitellinus]NAZ78235.1 SpoIIE family protein phosphatase [Kineococcus vitellinus]
MVDDGARRRALVLALSLTWVVVLTVTQHVADGRLVVVPWLALAAFVASLYTSWRATSLVAGAATAAVALLSADAGDLPGRDGLVRVAGSAALAVMAVLSAHVRARREQHVRQVTEVATVAQTAILAPVPARVGHLDLASRYQSASAHALVGGDLFDAVATEGSVRVVLGDVRGKGLPAVHTAAAVLSAFRHSAPQPDVCLAELARRVEASVAPRLAAEDFVTAVFCEVCPDGRLDVVLCGHPAPLRVGADGVVAAVGEHRSPPLGLGVEPLVETGRLGGRERLLLFTDGLAEARDAAGRFFDVEAAAGALAAGGDLDAALERLLEDVREHAGGRIDDDLALLLLQRRSS